MAYMGQFAATGNPNASGSGLPVWTGWSNSPNAANYMSFDSTFNTAVAGMIKLP
jgi:hypothetical protein